MSRQRASQHKTAEAGLHDVLHGLPGIDALLVVLTLAYFLVAHTGFAHPVLYVTSVVAYGMLALAWRHVALLAGLVRSHLLTAPVAMVVFITCMLVSAGGDRGPLLNLYLLPIITSAITAGRRAMLVTCAMALLGRILLSRYVEAVDVATLSYALTVLAEAAPVLLVAYWTTMLADGIRQAGERLQAASDLDEVTGLLNLTAFTLLLREEHALACRRRDSFALILVDVADLKSVNEQFGHDAGNRVLAAVAQVLKRSTRSADLLARYGGDEFLLFLSGAGAPVAANVANRIRHNVATTIVDVGGRVHRPGVSIGVAVFPVDGRDLRDLIKVADRAAEADRERRRPYHPAAPAAQPDSARRTTATEAGARAP